MTVRVDMPDAVAIAVTEDMLTARLSDGRTISGRWRGIPDWSTLLWRSETIGRSMREASTCTGLTSMRT